MRILFLVHAFNSLSQRLYVELARLGHELSVEFDVNDAVTAEAVDLWRPELIVAPFLKRAIAAWVWQRCPCLVVHPGVRGDRGPAALDRAIAEGRSEWGVTVLQANAELDAGDIWAWENFPLPPADTLAGRKSSVYRGALSEAAVRAVVTAVGRFAAGDFRPQPLDYADPAITGRPHAPLRQAERALDWQHDDSAAILRRINAADGFPGVLDSLAGEAFYLYDACFEATLRGAPGEIIARRDGAICRATVDGAVWIGHLKRQAGPAYKLPATTLLADRLAGVAEVALDPFAPAAATRREIWCEIADGVGYLHFPFYNGAMSTGQCQRLREVYRQLAGRPEVRVIVLMGGADFWSNGIHLNLIEHADSAADESWRNIEAMNDLALTILTTTDRLTLAALRGNAGAGGVFLALAADEVHARAGVVLNPHYKGMGNLYGSEYWTYLLPRRVGAERAAALVGNRLPVGAPEAAAMGLIDGCFGVDQADYRGRIETLARELAASPDYSRRLAEKRARREADERAKPLAVYRAEEMQHMRRNFYGFDSSYHVARYHFVHKLPVARTPLYLARHRS